ncbi:MAG TPA: hypothetical protein VK615_17660 [Candidatus Binatia bacterium]|nr:hypothetical protein [Candidatus Binatia bacterium]
MSKFLTFSQLQRTLGLSYPRARKLRDQGVFIPSGEGSFGPLYSAAFLPRWREAITNKPEHVAGGGDTLSSDCPLS